MPVIECCNTDVVCCEADLPVPQVAALMRQHHVGDVVVTARENGDLMPIGIVTDRDIVLETVAEEVDVHAFTAGDLMSTPLGMVTTDAGIVETLRTMRKHMVRRLPVVTESGVLYGIVTADDLINLLAKELSMMTETIVYQQNSEVRRRR